MRSKLLTLFFAVLLINVQLASAASILGKVAVYNSHSVSNVRPLISGEEVRLGEKALVRLAGATLIIEKGTWFRALDEGDRVVLYVTRGELAFKLQPERSITTFKTPQGEVSSPAMVRASTSATVGRIIVNGRGTTIEIAEGEMMVLSAKGYAGIDSGDRIVLAQAMLEEEGEEVSAPPKNLEELIGTKGDAASILKPDGTVNVNNSSYNAVVVDENLEPIDEAALDKGTPVVVKGVKGDGTLLVQPVDRSLIAAWLPSHGAGGKIIAGAVAALLLGGGATAGGIVAASQSNDNNASPDGE